MPVAGTPCSRRSPFSLADTVHVKGLVENLTLTGTNNINGTGNIADNNLTGNGGDNTLDGGAGNDNLYGGGGTDTLIGGSGNDRLDGGVGNDTMKGGIGDDTYVVDSQSDVVDETGGDGIDTIETSLSYILAAAVRPTVAGTGVGIENLTLTGTAPINGTGNDLDNVITGNSGVNTLDGGNGNDTLYGGAGVDTLLGGAGDDRLDGGTGADTMKGGAGNDTYVVDDANDKVDETDGLGNDLTGTDTVQSMITLSLADTAHVKGVVENLVLTGSGNINGTGNNADNVIPPAIPAAIRSTAARVSTP